VITLGLIAKVTFNEAQAVEQGTASSQLDTPVLLFGNHTVNDSRQNTVGNVVCQTVRTLINKNGVKRGVNVKF